MSLPTEVRLLRYEAMCLAISACHQIDEVKEIHNKARALEIYAQQAKNFDAERKAAEVRVRAERRAGEILKEMEKGGQRAGVSDGASSRCARLDKPTLSDLGITRDQSSKWQQLADIPEERFEAALSNTEKPTTQGILSVHFSSESAEWYTPQEIIERTVKVLGLIDLDPCSDKTRAVPARKHFTQAEDGLKQAWLGHVYMNPPYGREIGPWVQKLVREHITGSVDEAVALVPARVDTEWFREFRDCAVCFISGRLKFSGHENSAPFPSAAVYLGEHVDNFDAAFCDIGDVWIRWIRQCAQG